jgi:thioredoxin 1
MASENVVVLDSGNWQREVEQSEVPVLVDFYAPWCVPCRQLTPIVEKLATKYAGKVKVAKLNVDDSPDLASKYGIVNIPRVYIFKGGDQPREKLVGLKSEAELSKLLDGVLQG